MEAMERACFFFGDDVTTYLEQLWSDICDVRAADNELPAANDLDTRRAILQKRRGAIDRIGQFHKAGQPLFARYMRFSQTIRGSLQQ